MKKNDLKPTDLTLEELLTAYNNPKSGYESSFLINGIARFLDEGGEEAEKAEAFLRDLLDSNNSDDKHLAFFIIADLETIDEETFKKFEKAKKDPDNIEFLKKVLGKVAKAITNEVV